MSWVFFLPLQPPPPIPPGWDKNYKMSFILLSALKSDQSRGIAPNEGPARCIRHDEWSDLSGGVFDK